MNRPRTALPFDVGLVLHFLQPLHHTTLDPCALVALADAIMPYVARSQLPLSDAVRKISSHYLQDGARVRRLMDDPRDIEWQAVLTQVLTFATKHALYPDDTEATSWPDLDAYQDIQQKLPSYNFEGSLDSWVTVTILNRLRRFWRDRQALSAGGPGFRSKTATETTPEPTEPLVVTKLFLYSLDMIADDERLMAEIHGADHLSVGHCVEDAELWRTITEVVHDFAVQKHDVQLQQIWHAVVERQLKLREASLCFGLTISQIHRRLEQVRAHLRQHPRIAHWFTLGE